MLAVSPCLRGVYAGQPSTRGHFLGTPGKHLPVFLMLSPRHFNQVLSFRPEGHDTWRDPLPLVRHLAGCFNHQASWTIDSANPSA